MTKQQNDAKMICKAYDREVHPIGDEVRVHRVKVVRAMLSRS